MLQSEVELKQRRPYQKPAIVRHAVGRMNPYGSMRSAAPFTHLDGRAIQAMMDEFGSPLWMVSEATLRRQYRKLARAFELHYPRTVIAYSYKTNYLGAICSVLHREGAWAEVVSGPEYALARANGVKGEHILFNGPLKQRDELRRAFAEGARVNLDSLEEIALAEEVARQLGQRLAVGLRVNVRLDANPWDRFGLNLENGEAAEAARRIVGSPHLRLRGLHCHIGTYVLDPNRYGLALERVLDLCHLLRQQHRVEVEDLDLGGGFAAGNSLHGEPLPAEYACPAAEDYARAIGPRLLAAGFENLPILFLEPGRFLVDEAMHLGTSVVSNRRLGNGSRGVVVDAGVNLLYTANWYRHDIVPAFEGGGMLEEATVFGSLCMQIDILRHGVPLPPVRRGDPLVVKRVGAYNFSQSWQFIQTRPAVVLVGAHGVELIRARESWQDWRRLEQIPARLRLPG